MDIREGMETALDHVKLCLIIVNVHKSKGIAKVPLKRPVRADLGNVSLPESWP